MSHFTRLMAASAFACVVACDPALAQTNPAGAAPTFDRALTIDDVLAMETFGTAALSPDGVWVAYERRRPYETAPRFDRSHRSGWAISDLMIVRTAGGDPEPLLPSEAGTGVLLASWSPDSRRLLVHRLREDRLEVGVVTIADRSVLWTGLAPELINGVTSTWLDGDRLALTIRPGGDLPWLLRFDGTGQAEMARRWIRTAEGREPSRSRVESHGGRVTTDASPLPVQLIVLDVATGDHRVLEEGAIRDFAVSPAGDHIAVVTSRERAARMPLSEIAQSEVQTRSRLTVLEVETGRRIQMDVDLDVAPYLLRWSARGDAVLLWARRDGEPWSAATLVAAKIDGGLQRFETADLLPFEEGRNVDEVRVTQADWLGPDAVLKARKPGSERFDWWRVGTGTPELLTQGLASPPGRLSAVTGTHALAFADGRLWALGAGEEPQPITPEGRALTDGESWTLMTPFRVQANEAPRRSWVASRSASEVRVLGEDGTASVIATPSCDGTWMGRSVVHAAILGVCIDQGVETMVLAGVDIERAIDRVNGNLTHLGIPRARAITHKNPFGQDVTSYLFLPPGMAPSEVRGLIVLVYPGVTDAGRFVEATSLQTLGPKAQLLASRGYAVLSAAVPDESLTTRATMFDVFTRGADLAVDAAVEATPSLPNDRLALLGHSFGGYAALAIATRSSRYRSIVSWAAPTDPANKWSELRPHAWIWPEYAMSLDTGPGSVENGQARLGGPPWSDIEGYAAASPFMQADRIAAPLLLITADRDYVPMSNAQRMLSAMHRQGKWARLVTYWGETHSNASPANVRDVYREIFDWLDRTLGAEPLSGPADAAPMPEPSFRRPPSS